MAANQNREITECPICMSTFNDPRMLPCTHTFCFECLNLTADAVQKKAGDKVPCPLCRKEFTIPREGIVALQKNFFMEFRQTIERRAWKISNYADEMMSIRKITETRKAEFLNKIIEEENKIHKRNLELKEMIEKGTKSLLNELSVVKSNNLKEFENEMEEIDTCCTIFRSFEDYCNELRLEGSDSDIWSSIDEIIDRADELEKDHEAFIDRALQSVEVSFQTTDKLREALQKSNDNIVGQIKAETKQSTRFENSAIVVGLDYGPTITRDVVEINLHRSNEISPKEQIPTRMAFEAFAAVYCNTMYVTGIGDNAEEIWRYNMAYGWKKCASLVQGRRRHSAAFIDEVLYICGGFVDYNKRVLDSVEAYNAITDKCCTVGKLVHGVHSSGNCVPFRSSLFIFGGLDEHETQVSHVEVYNTEQNTCTLLSKPLPRPCYRMRAVLSETSAILFGPFTCLIFNFSTEKWGERKKFKTDVGHFGLVLENEQVFVIGGGISQTDKDGKTTWKCRDDVRSVPLQNIIKKKPIEWKIHLKLAEPCFVHACAKIRLPVRGGDRNFGSIFRAVTNL